MHKYRSDAKNYKLTRIQLVSISLLIISMTYLVAFDTLRSFDSTRDLYAHLFVAMALPSLLIALSLMRKKGESPLVNMFLVIGMAIFIGVPAYTITFMLGVLIHGIQPQ